MKAVPRFMSKVSVSSADQCWPWVAAKDKKGYGVIFFRGAKRLAHRVSWTLMRGAIPPGLFVCHRCDNPPCVNPDHLFLGTNADNMADMVSKGRANRETRCSDGRYSRSVLTEDDVINIRSLKCLGATTRTLASEFGVSIPTISHVVRRYSWKHV